MIKQFHPVASPAPAKIVIEQRPDGSFTCTHNLKPLFLIGVLSTMISQTASEMVRMESMIVGSNGKVVKESQPESETNAT